ncbi:MAG: hypothetical protein FJW95_16180, partial [Actinobacteria bacterium]|nr:hypothetical protein [Actinomycetota bacterium]
MQPGPNLPGACRASSAPPRIRLPRGLHRPDPPRSGRSGPDVDSRPTAPAVDRHRAGGIHRGHVREARAGGRAGGRRAGGARRGHRRGRRGGGRLMGRRRAAPGGRALATGLGISATFGMVAAMAAGSQASTA